MHNRVGADDGGGGGAGEIAEAGRPRRIDKSKSATEHALKGLRFMRGAAVTGGWTAVEKCFDKEAKDGLLHRAKFGTCIGMKGPRDLEFACELFDALARRRNIHRDSIYKAELYEFWELISDNSFNSRLQIFFDMVDKDADGRIDEKEVKEIIMLSASANNLTMVIQQSEEYVRLIMEELDPDGIGYIELFHLEMLLLRGPDDSRRNRGTTNIGNLSKVSSQRLPPTSEPKPDPPQQWYSHARYFLEDNWRRCWVMLLWLSICVGLFGWKFVQYRRRAAFEVMGYCVCVAKGGAETLKFNMALILLPVCRNTITWLRSRTDAGRFIPFDDSIGFHTVIAVGISIGTGLHVVSHLTCDFPRLLRATDAEYEPMKPFFGDLKPPNYWWFLKGTEGWTGLVMLVLMDIAFTLATPSFRRGKLRLSDPKAPPGSINRLTRFVDAALKRLTGFNAFWYTHLLD